MKGLLSFLLGAAAGAAAVSLFTTEKGDELRFQIREYLRRKGICKSSQLDEYVELIATEIEDNNTEDNKKK